jgi:predicted PurR-regulated permease PerM
LIALVIYKYVPVLIAEIADIFEDLKVFKFDPSQYKYGEYIMPIINQIDFSNYIKTGSNYLIKFASNIGNWSFNILAAFVLSIFFLVENEKVGRFFRRFEKSRVSWFYEYMKYLGNNFLNSFGKVIQAQIVIAMTNSILSVIILSILGFPKLLAIGAMVFIFGLVPVAGVVISLIITSLICFVKQENRSRSLVFLPVTGTQ